MAKILSQHIAHPSPKMQETLEPYSRNPFGRTLTKGFTGGCVACE